MRNEVGGWARERQRERIKHILGVFPDRTPSSELLPLSGHSPWVKVDTSRG